MNKHTPATPLPWELDDESQICADNTVVAYPPTSAKRQIADKDAAYIAHAANAYPKLVEALRRMHIDLSDFTDPDSDFDWTEHAGRSMVRALDALLREIGEE